MKARAIVAAGFGIATACTATELSATTVDKWSLSNLLWESSYVALFRVVENDPFAGAEAAETKVELRTVEPILGGLSVEATLIFFLPEGQEPNDARCHGRSPRISCAGPGIAPRNQGGFVTIQSAPKFNEDEIYLAFLKEGPWAFTPVTNWYHSIARLDRGLGVFVNTMGQCLTHLSRDLGLIFGPVVTYPEAYIFRTPTSGTVSLQSVPDETEGAFHLSSAEGCLPGEDVVAGLREIVRNTPSLQGRVPDLQIRSVLPMGGVTAATGLHFPAAEVELPMCLLNEEDPSLVCDFAFGEGEAE